MKLSVFPMFFAALALPVAASAQRQACIPQQQGNAVVAYLLPDILQSTVERCARFLPRDSYLTVRGAELAARQQPLAERSWPEAKQGLETAFNSELPDDPTILAFGRKAIADGVTKNLDAKGCDAVSSLSAELAPLPASNFANVFAVFLRLGLSESKDTELRICEV